MTGFRDDAKADEMYNLYNHGFSLSQIAAMQGVTRQNIYKIFACRGFALRTKKALPFIMYNGVKYTLRYDGYYRSTVTKTFLHRDVWESVNGAVPVGFAVHHVSGDKQDNSIGNLALISSVNHGKLHAETNVGFKSTQFKKGSTGHYYPRKS